MNKELNQLWDCFHPYDKDKTLKKWEALITKEKSKSWKKGFNSGAEERIEPKDNDMWPEQ